MIMITPRESFLLFFLICGSLVIIMLRYYVGSDIHSAIKVAAAAIEFHPNSPQFAFILNTEECLPVHLRTKEYFGAQPLCNCHVYVISYRKPCTDTNAQFLHVTYILANDDVGFSAGRNIGYDNAKRSGSNYLYYIFLDDDIKLQYNKYTSKSLRDKGTSPLKIFSDYLLDEQPAIASVEYHSWNTNAQILDQWHSLCDRFKTPRVIAIYHHDENFKAIHRNAVGSLLPYVEEYDKLLIWLSAIEMTYATNVAFYGQHVFFPEIELFNEKHRYAQQKGYFHDTSIRKKMIENIRRRTPAEYQNHSVFELLLAHPIGAGKIHTLCLDPPEARSSVIPYRIMYDSKMKPPM